LYLSLGLPVIVWKEAAIASFVTENQLGFTIGSFDELEKIAENVTENEYKKYVLNIQNLSNKVRTGFFLNKAITHLIK